MNGSFDANKLSRDKWLALNAPLPLGHQLLGSDPRPTCSTAQPCHNSATQLLSRSASGRFYVFVFDPQRPRYTTNSAAGHRNSAQPLHPSALIPFITWLLMPHVPSAILASHLFGVSPLNSSRNLNCSVTLSPKTELASMLSLTLCIAFFDWRFHCTLLARLPSNLQPRSHPGGY